MTEEHFNDGGEVDPSSESDAPSSGGFMKFYGLYWAKKFILEKDDTESGKEKIIAGLPTGWSGRGRFASDFDRSAMWVNFWEQKGVYVLYDKDLLPVYTGQAGLTRRGSDGDGRTLGDRLRDHKHGKYRNGWEYFSWFGFLEAENEREIKRAIRQTTKDASDLKKAPKWRFNPRAGDEGAELNLLLDSFEAILIEAFTPKFNSRGGNLTGATYVNQCESVPYFLNGQQA